MEYSSEQLFDAICREIEREGFPVISYAQIQRGKLPSEVYRLMWHEGGSSTHKVDKKNDHTTILFKKLLIPTLPFGVEVDNEKELLFEVEYTESFCPKCRTMQSRSATVYDNARSVAKTIPMGKRMY